MNIINLYTLILKGYYVKKFKSEVRMNLILTEKQFNYIILYFYVNDLIYEKTLIVLTSFYRMQNWGTEDSLMYPR